MSEEISFSTRRTQVDRSDAMRQRLIDATLHCLINDGYAGTTISKIVETAQVSRGAPLHHFSSKAALIEATAEHLIRKFYESLGKMISNMDASDDRLNDYIATCWQHLLTTPEATAVLELLVAGRHEPELAAVMQNLWVLAYRYTRGGAETYLEPITPDDNVADLIILTQWLLRGMAEDRHMNAETADAALFFDRYLKLWSSLLANHLRSKAKADSDMSLEKANNLDAPFPKFNLRSLGNS